MLGSGSPFVKSFRGEELDDLDGGTKETETEVGEIVPAGTSVYPLDHKDTISDLCLEEKI
jgi:hypothetical protein